jgi:hypothetical protein
MISMKTAFMEHKYEVFISPDDSDQSLTIRFDMFPFEFKSFLTANDARKLAGLLIYAADTAEGLNDELEHLINERKAA